MHLSQTWLSLLLLILILKLFESKTVGPTWQFHDIQESTKKNEKRLTFLMLAFHRQFPLVFFSTPARPEIAKRETNREQERKRIEKIYVCEWDTLISSHLKSSRVKRQSFHSSITALPPRAKSMLRVLVCNLCVCIL